MDPDDVSTPTNEAVRVLGPQARGTPNSALPSAVTTADQVEIKIVGQAPPHPQAAGELTGFTKLIFIYTFF